MKLAGHTSARFASVSFDLRPGHTSTGVALVSFDLRVAQALEFHQFFFTYGLHKR